MKIFALETANEDFKGLRKDLSTLVEIEMKASPKDLLEDIEDCDSVLIDLDTETRAMDKLIKKIRKVDPEVPIFVLCNSLDNKKLSKHQSTKTSPDLYFRYPTEREVLEIMISEFFEFSDELELSDSDTALAAEHAEVPDMPSQIMRVNSKLDDEFAGAFPDEFEGLQDLNEPSADLEVEEVEDPGSEDLVEFDAGDISDFSLDDEPVDELSQDDSSEVSMETQLPSSEDLEFPDIEESGATIDLETQDHSDELSMDHDDGLQLSDFDLSQTERSDIIELETEEPEPFEAGDSETLSLDESHDELTLSLEDDEPEVGLSLNEENGAEDDAAELNLSSEELFENEEDNNTNLLLASELGENLSSESMGDDEVDENFDPFADMSSGDDDIAVKGEPSELDLKLSDSLEIEEQTLGQTDIKSLFGDQDESEAEKSFLIEDNYVEESTATASYADEGIDLDLSPEEVQLPESPPEFTTEFQTKISEIDALVSDVNHVSEVNEVDEEATLVSALNEAETKVATIDSIMPNREEEEDTTRVFQAEDLVKHIEGENEDEDEFRVENKFSQSVSEGSKQDLKDYMAHRDEELIRLGETIKSLRADREKLLLEVTALEERQNSEKRDFLSLQAELDERSIEVEVLKKRYGKEIEDLKFRLDMTSDRKEVLVAKNKQIEQEYDKLRREKKVDTNRIRARERELEEKLELLKTDSEVQLRNRDHKILELKRRIDTLEFDIENAHLSERKKTTDKDLLEDRLDKVIKTLRGVIGQIEDDSVEERRNLIKKNMDV